jgi:hypothetical protein
VERAGGSRSGRYTCAIGAHGQTYQRRISDRSLDPADQHYDARARPGDRAISVASACIVTTGSDRASAVTASGFDHSARTGSGQKAARAETSARRVRAGSISASGARSRGRERLMLSKAFADR